MTVTYAEFFDSTMREGGFSVSAETITALLAGARAEDTKAEWNPLATEEPMEGSSNFNEAGVKNYDSLEIGRSAILRTLSLPRYASTRAALKEGSDSKKIVEAFIADGWTGGSDAWLTVLDGGLDLASWGATPVPGSTPATPDPVAPTPAPKASLSAEAAATLAKIEAAASGLVSDLSTLKSQL